MKLQSHNPNPSWDGFPVNDLPDVLRRYILDQSEQLNVHPSMIFAPAISALGVAIGNKRKIHTTGSHYEYPSVWTILVQPAGGRKSPSLKSGTSAITGIQEAYTKEFQEGKSSTRKSIKVVDATIPALNVCLSKNPRGVLWCVDEFTMITKSIRSGEFMYSGQVLSYWNSEQVIVQRKNAEDIIIPSGYVFGVATTTQTKLLKKLMNQVDGLANGFADRFLYCSPEPIETEPSKKKFPPPEDDPHFKLFFALHYYFIEKITDEKSLELDDDALNYYREFQHANQKKARETDDTYYGKLDVHILRIALILELVKDFDAKAKLGALQTNFDANTVTLETLKLA
ncbi:MAG: DUF3987 domain-containing protein, partial [Verrucomicrobia bacterium]|nr:DUF3987 domain-containing protein [Verrucomicrobiota bacterium]